MGTPSNKSVTARNSASVFDSWNRRYVTGGVTIDREAIPPDASGRRVIRAGEVVGKIAATGKYAPWDGAASDGRQTPRGVVVQDADCADGDAWAGICDECRVHEARMPRRFTPAQWAALAAGEFVRVTRAEPFSTPGPKAVSAALAPSSATVAVGGRVQLAAVFNPGDAIDKSGTWQSSNPAAASVDAGGAVSGVAAGTATITFSPWAEGLAPVTAAVTVS